MRRPPDAAGHGGRRYDGGCVAPPARVRLLRRAAMRIVVDRDTIDRLTVLARIADAADPAQRERLFMALMPVWRTVNGDDDARSPYRTLLRFGATQTSRANQSPLDRAADIGVEPATLERWLVTILDAWRVAIPDSAVEPWDYYYLAAEADRRLDARIRGIRCSR